MHAWTSSQQVTEVLIQHATHFSVSTPVGLAVRTRFVASGVVAQHLPRSSAQRHDLRLAGSTARTQHAAANMPNATRPEPFISVPHSTHWSNNGKCPKTRSADSSKLISTPETARARIESCQSFASKVEQLGMGITVVGQFVEELGDVIARIQTSKSRAAARNLRSNLASVNRSSASDDLRRNTNRDRQSRSSADSKGPLSRRAPFAKP